MRLPPRERACLYADTPLRHGHVRTLVGILAPGKGSSYRLTSLSFPVATSKTNPRSDVVWVMNGLALTRRND